MKAKTLATPTTAHEYSRPLPPRDMFDIDSTGHVDGAEDYRLYRERTQTVEARSATIEDDVRRLGRVAMRVLHVMGEGIKINRAEREIRDQSRVAPEGALLGSDPRDTPRVVN